jgi:hypothetical protein
MRTPERLRPEPDLAPRASPIAIPSPEGYTSQLPASVAPLSLEQAATRQSGGVKGRSGTSWVTYFNRKFGMMEGSLGSLFFVTNILSLASNLAASSIARRIGLTEACL